MDEGKEIITVFTALLRCNLPTRTFTSRLAISWAELRQIYVPESCALALMMAISLTKVKVVSDLLVEVSDVVEH